MSQLHVVRTEEAARDFRAALVLVEGGLGDRMSGPAIRGLELARALAERYELTVAASVPAPYRDGGLRVVPWTRRRVLREARRQEVIAAPWIPPYALLAAGSRTVAVADLYDPAELELEAHGAHGTAAAVRRLTRLQLAYADVILCAAKRQRERLQDELARLRRRRAPPIAVVPFGLARAPPPSASTPIRARFPAIAAGDRIVLWWGSLWSWLDPESAIRAAALWTQTRPDVKLVFSAGRPPGDAAVALDRSGAARDLARSLGLLDRAVFFLDDWIPYGDRHEYLLEADVGLTLHRETREARLAARARYADYLWCGLPCVLARGDELAERLGRGRFASLVPPGDPDAASKAVLDLLEAPDRIERARAAGGPLAEDLRWPRVLAPAVEAVERLEGRRSERSERRAALVRDVASYYGARVRRRS